MNTNGNYKVGWDLSKLLESEDSEAIESKLKVVRDENYAFISKWKSRQDYLESPEILALALTEFENLAARFGTDGEVGYYFDLKSSLEQDNPDIKARQNKIIESSVKIANDIQFFTYNIARIPQTEQKKFLTFSGLTPYKHFLESLFNEAKYLLSEPEEKILNLKAMTSYANWVNMTADFISREVREGKTVSELITMTTDKDKKTRKKAAKHLNNIFEKHLDTAEAEINSILTDKKINDELRNVTRPDEIRHLSDDIDSAVVDALLTAVESAYTISKNYYKFKAKLLGLKKLNYFEKSVEYGEIDKEFTYDASVDLVYKTLTKLDPEFGTLFMDYVTNGQIDVYSKKGKYSGAYCTHHLKTQPGFIILNHHDRLRDVTTIAHEMGHAINNELIRKAQNALNFDTPLSTAEVASTFMEDFVLDELEKEADDQTRLELMIIRLDDAVASIFRQVACYKFEQDLHSSFREKGYLSKVEIGELFLKHMKSYTGSGMTFTKGTQNWWVYWSHIRSYFYVYSYASGLLISKTLQRFVKKDPSFIVKVKEFLSAGTSATPNEVFLTLGIDIKDKKFWQNGLEEINQQLEEAQLLAKKLGKV